MSSFFSSRRRHTRCLSDWSSDVCSSDLYDAGDFDLEEPAQLSVIQSLALAYRAFDLKYDELMVDEAAREVEMHRPDGVPDTVQQVKHGALLILAQFHNIGHSIRGTHEPDLRQYTQI